MFPVAVVLDQTGSPSLVILAVEYDFQLLRKPFGVAGVEDAAVLFSVGIGLEIRHRQHLLSEPTQGAGSDTSPPSLLLRLACPPLVPSMFFSSVSAGACDPDMRCLTSLAKFLRLCGRGKLIFVSAVLPYTATVTRGRRRGMDKLEYVLWSTSCWQQVEAMTTQGG